MLLRVKEWRQVRGWTQRQLATRAGCSRELISSIETARYAPNTDRLAELAAALDVPIQDLFPPPTRPGRPRRAA
jgi:transcriptional regulator with XRE-family HTH domain